MKKLLVTLLLAAGFITVASAYEPLDCTNNTTNQCCIDVSSMTTTIQQSSQHYILSTDRHAIVYLDPDIMNDGTDSGSCITLTSYMQNSWGDFEWQPGNWANTIHHL